MSTNRRIPPAPYVKNPATGRYECRQCGSDVEPPRRTFCSQECVDAYNLARSNQAGRDMVEARDKGICELCQCDTKAEREKFRAEINAVRNERKGNESYDSFSKRYRELEQEVIDRWIEKGWPRSIINRMSWWDMDHRVPVIDGGGECGLDNLRTLCLKCHTIETSKLNKRLAQERRREKEIQSGQSTIFEVAQ